MPFLRFARDRRGYESTFLLQPGRRRTGEERPQLLYWFRSPPHVKVGRAAFDEDAIRLLEETHPDLDFDWERILTTRPPAAPELEDARPRRAERRGPRDARRGEPRVMRPAGPPEPVPESPPPLASAAPPGPAAAEDVELLAPPFFEPAEPTPPVVPPPTARRFVRVFDTAPGPAEHRATEVAVAERLLGAERLTILRARYAEILARIAARGGDPLKVDALRARAEQVNPDAWVTEAEVAAGLAAADATLAELHRLVGRRRRRRRHQDSGEPGAGPDAAGAAAPAAEIADDGEEEEPGDEGEA